MVIDLADLATGHAAAPDVRLDETRRPEAGPLSAIVPPGGAMLNAVLAGGSLTSSPKPVLEL